MAPWSSSVKLAAANPRTTTLVETTASPHGFELTVPDMWLSQNYTNG